MKSIGSIGIVVLFAAVGCDKPATPNADLTPAPAPAATPMQQATGVVTSGDILSGAPAGGAAGAPAGTPAPAPEPAATEQVKAETGVGIKGQSLQEHTGVLVEPAKAYFRVEQRVVFDIQIPQALQLFEASEGRKPKSEEEFMSRIIAGNNIKLPKLPAGQKYVYNVENAELMVERPAK